MNVLRTKDVKWERVKLSSRRSNKKARDLATRGGTKQDNKTETEQDNKIGKGQDDKANTRYDNKVDTR